MMPLKLLLTGAIVSAVVSAVSMANAQTPPATPNPNAPVYVVGYIDVAQASKSQAMTLLKQFRTSCAKEEGNQRCEVAQRMEQQNEFVVLEVWKDQKSFQGHSTGPGAQFRDRLKPMLTSPYDERVHTALSVTPPQPAPAGRIVYTVTHIDVIPPRLSEAAPLLTPMAEASRKDPGNARFEVLQQLAPRTNHFSFVEIWLNKRQLEAHQALPRTVQFRDKLQPLLGALYDERLYKVLD
jgi:quinol monooxygenase YgiN